MYARRDSFSAFEVIGLILGLFARQDFEHAEYGGGGAEQKYSKKIFAAIAFEVWRMFLKGILKVRCFSTSRSSSKTNHNSNIFPTFVFTLSFGSGPIEDDGSKMNGMRYLRRRSTQWDFVFSFLSVHPK